MSTGASVWMDAESRPVTASCRISDRSFGTPFGASANVAKCSQKVSAFIALILPVPGTTRPSIGRESFATRPSGSGSRRAIHQDRRELRCCRAGS